MLCCIMLSVQYHLPKNFPELRMLTSLVNIRSNVQQGMISGTQAALVINSACDCLFTQHIPFLWGFSALSGNILNVTKLHFI